MRMYKVLLIFLMCMMSVSETYIWWRLQLKDPQQVTTDLASRETSASAHLAAGITALALKSNPALTWRDVRYIVIRVSRPAGLRREYWHSNGEFSLVSHYFGHGRLDADRLMGMGRNWRSVQFQKKCCRGVITRPSVLSGKFTLQWNRTVCQGSENWIWSLERLRLHLTHADTRCALTISISSVRPLDWSCEGFHEWPFVHKQFWNKALAGYWDLQTESTYNLDRSELPSQVQMELYGTKKHMIHHRLRRHIVPNCEIKDQYGTCEDIPVCAYPYYLYEKFCLASCPPHHYEEEGNRSRPSRTCVPCHQTCNTCYGPLNTQCLACPPFSTPDPNEGTCKYREYTWERARRRQEPEMCIILALFFVLLLILTTCTTGFLYRNYDAQTEAIAIEMVERSHV